MRRSSPCTPEDFYSIGGGFIIRGDEGQGGAAAEVNLPYPFTSGDEFLAQCAKHELQHPRAHVGEREELAP